MPKKVGEYLINEDYMIATGEICKVFKATGPKGDVVCRSIRKDLLMKKLREPDLTREVKILQKLKYKHVVQFHDVIQTSKSVYIMLELCAGSSHMLMNGGLRTNSLERVQHVFRQLVLAVVHIHHRGIAHRNINPGCVLLDSRGNVKLTGFSCSVGGSANHYSFPYRRLDNYLAPEILLPKTVFSPTSDKSDLWGLGAFLYFLNHGTGPFDGGHSEDFKEKVLNCRFHCSKAMNSDARQIIRGLIVKEPMKRMSLLELCEASYLSDMNEHVKVDQQTGKPIFGISQLEIDYAKGLASEEGFGFGGEEVTIFNVQKAPKTGEVQVSSKHLSAEENTAVEAVPMVFQKIESPTIGSPLSPSSDPQNLSPLTLGTTHCPNFSGNMAHRRQKTFVGSHLGAAKKRVKPVVRSQPLGQQTRQARNILVTPV